MPNKNTPNGFYMFMLEEQKKIKAQTKRAPSMHEMPSMCRDPWKSLSAAEKAHYDNLAKHEKARQRGGSSNKDMYRKDNQRQIIAYRKDAKVEKEKRRRHETETMMKSWRDEDSLDQVFHVIDFQVMYDVRAEDHHLPVELGMVAFNLRDGIQKSFHTFIDPGEIPQGNKLLAFKHSENTHKIPVDFDQGDKNYEGIWSKINSFLQSDATKSEDIPPLFCLVRRCFIYLFFCF
ncbi:protein maelstrom homolog [Elysia marginata]|uniref:Protein maelstrom homolog n=1 Tax=Elysia marginata TaxID=1093978 RepID=A0AAV4JHC5_9GAST|nr:protein maelstrom homolog [Elysia marginata]